MISRHYECVDLLLHALATMLAPDNADLSQFYDYAENREFALALDELAAIVNGREA
jgi:hypothetical protein